MTVRARKKCDARKYGQLLAQVQPRPIQSEEENERLLAVVDRLMATRDDERTPEEDVLLELLCQLIERFEEEHYPVPDSPPHRVLQFLMEQNDVPESELLPILGSRGQVTEVLSGRRGISKAQAQALGEFFHVSPDPKSLKENHRVVSNGTLRRTSQVLQEQANKNVQIRRVREVPKPKSLNQADKFQFGVSISHHLGSMANILILQSTNDRIVVRNLTHEVTEAICARHAFCISRQPSVFNRANSSRSRINSASAASRAARSCSTSACNRAACSSPVRIRLPSRSYNRNHPSRTPR
jgi:HTH-type transcriptional regulator/antitoxin HigA